MSINLSVWTNNLPTGSVSLIPLQARYWDVSFYTCQLCQSATNFRLSILLTNRQHSTSNVQWNRWKVTNCPHIFVKSERGMEDWNNEDIALHWSFHYLCPYLLLSTQASIKVSVKTSLGQQRNTSYHHWQQDMNARLWKLINVIMILLQICDTVLLYQAHAMIYPSYNIQSF